MLGRARGRGGRHWVGVDVEPKALSTIPMGCHDSCVQPKSMRDCELLRIYIISTIKTDKIPLLGSINE